MTTSETLPEDVFRQIASYRTNPLSLYLLSRNSHSLAEPYLYQVLDISPRPQQPLNANAPPSAIASLPKPHLRLHQILNRLLARPDLAVHVRELSIWAFKSQIKNFQYLKMYNGVEYNSQPHGVYESYVGLHAAFNPELPAAFFAKVLATARKYGMTDGFMNGGGCNAEVVLLLHILPNLKILRVGGSIPGVPMEFPDVFTYLRWAGTGCIQGGIPRGLQSVTRIGFPMLPMTRDVDERAYWDSASSLETTVGLMGLPSLKSIQAWLDPRRETGQENGGLMDWGARIPDLEGTSGVTELSLSFRSLPSAEADICSVPDTILGLPKTLTRLTFHLDIIEGDEDAIDALVEELFTRTETLEYLDFQTWGPVSRDVAGYFFTDFTHLRHLVVTTNVFFGDALSLVFADHLKRSRTTDFIGSAPLTSPIPPLDALVPSSLETLEVWVVAESGWDLALLHSLDVFAAWKQSAELGNLKKVILRYQTEKVLREDEVELEDEDDREWFNSQEVRLENIETAAGEFRRQGLEVQAYTSPRER